MVGLRRSRGSGANWNEEDTDIAYVESGVLADRFPNIGEKVPQKYKQEFDKHKACLPDME
jgi:hypothetical protein